MGGVVRLETDAEVDWTVRPLGAHGAAIVLTVNGQTEVVVVTDSTNPRRPRVATTFGSSVTRNGDCIVVTAAPNAPWMLRMTYLFT